jgi:hypothetical protein
MLFKEIIAVHSENHMKHLSALWGQNAEFFNFRGDSTYNN